MSWAELLCADVLGHDGKCLGRYGAMGVCVERAGRLEEERCCCMSVLVLLHCDCLVFCIMLFLRKRALSVSFAFAYPACSRSVYTCEQVAGVYDCMISIYGSPR